MARDKVLLSDLQIRHWIRAGTPLVKADGNGLTFTLSTAGVAGWILRYRHGGRRRELTIGRYPDISLADARGLATIKRAEIMQRRNPAANSSTWRRSWARSPCAIEASDFVALIRVWHFILLPLAFLGLGVSVGDVGMVLFVPGAATYLAAACAMRAVARSRRAFAVDQAIDLEAWRINQQRLTFH